MHLSSVKNQSFNGLLQAAGAEERRRIGIGTAELTEEGHRLFGTALLEEGLATNFSQASTSRTSDHR